MNFRTAFAAKIFALTMATMLVSTIATTQVPDVVDPKTGNYVPGVDPLDKYDTRPSRQNPARINRRIAPRVDLARTNDTLAAPDASDSKANSLKYPSWWPK